MNGRVALLLRSAEVKPLFQRFVRRPRRTLLPSSLPALGQAGAGLVAGQRCVAFPSLLERMTQLLFPILRDHAESRRAEALASADSTSDPSSYLPSLRPLAEADPRKRQIARLDFDPAGAGARGERAVSPLRFLSPPRMQPNRLFAVSTVVPSSWRRACLLCPLQIPPPLWANPMCLGGAWAGVLPCAAEVAGGPAQ